MHIHTRISANSDVLSKGSLPSTADFWFEARVPAIATISSDELLDAFDGYNMKSILILDNCSVHHVETVKVILEDAGILELFLPPYNPDYNPIKEAIRFVQYYLQEHETYYKQYKIQVV